MVKITRQKGIVLFFTIFLVVILAWLIHSMSGSFLTENMTAHDDSLNYQARIVAPQKFAISPDGMTIDYISEANTVVVKFPVSQPAPVGKVLFFHPSNKQKDRGFELKTDPSKQMFIPLNDFEKGKWRVHVEWQGEDKIYTKEEIIAVQPHEWARPVH